MEYMAKNDFDADELFSLEMGPEQAPKEILDDADTEGEEVEMGPEEQETKA
jgi:hypothetical protein